MIGSPLECSIFCLISTAVIFHPKPENKKCSYCLDIRPIVQDCQNNPYECQDINPEGVIYCLNVFEYSTNVQSTVRCLSIWDIDLKNISKIVSNKVTVEVIRQVQSPYCTQKLMKQCNCSSCTIPSPPSIKKITNKENINKNRTKEINNLSNQLSNSLNEKIDEKKEILEEDTIEEKDGVPNFLIFKYTKKLFDSIFNNNNSSFNLKWNIYYTVIQLLFLLLVNKVF
uniref:Uncharacterized protein n=1 Tax=Strongyloides venezuelensis TaxID=75913 RepID=A0A0K0FG25_STRVS